MITTSFARFYDDNTEISAPLGWATATPVFAQDNGPDTEPALTQDGPRAGSLSDQFDDATRRKNNASEDGQLGGFVLDSLFAMVFPGLAAVFSPLNPIEAADLYDKTRDAFRRSAGQNPKAQPALPRYARESGPATKNRGPLSVTAANQRLMRNRPSPMVQRNRRAASGPAMMMG